MTPYNAPKLIPADVQAIRDLSRLGFTDESIAAAYRLSGAAVRNILTRRSWSELADRPAELPLLGPSDAGLLRLRSPRKLTADQTDRLAKYRAQLSAAHAHDAEQAGVPVVKFAAWDRPQWTPVLAGGGS